ncbi:hemophore-related protein [Nocardia otitidiscaviarum]|uniref:hemophore-related protein n=1 Tax=Nocardia otitidiscaviarum TaxID=1823 RepID=UPI00189316AC|nr:hemophore-related protein [Nocardia otitidiscaviarum]MBF6179438.1 hemophore-related protein [Nocardia otitidiscaviarum]
MSSTHSRPRRTIAAAGAFGALTAVSVWLFPATAAAAPADMVAPLLTSTCTFDQVDAALHDKAPALAQFLDQNPDTKAELRAKFDQPIEQRQAEFDAYLRANPEAAAQAENDPRAGGIAAAIQAVAESCHNY